MKNYTWLQVAMNGGERIKTDENVTEAWTRYDLRLRQTAAGWLSGLFCCLCRNLIRISLNKSSTSSLHCDNYCIAAD